jgi:hypothetical protein
MTPVAPRHLRVAGILADGGQLLAAVLLVPFAILAIGIPIALVIAALLWLARLADAAL